MLKWYVPYKCWSNPTVYKIIVQKNKEHENSEQNIKNRLLQYLCGTVGLLNCWHIADTIRKNRTLKYKIQKNSTGYANTLADQYRKANYRSIQDTKHKNRIEQKKKERKRYGKEKRGHRIKAIKCKNG